MPTFAIGVSESLNVKAAKSNQHLFADANLRGRVVRDGKREPTAVLWVHSAVK